ncbi:hypothetical protein EYF80_045856 [Liparis tanakae]|uniref:Uncharacterized protein n=1 Tax=Liparis tanakae TaxID=230148 RepID=A0A4Z2FUB0_9TELE|nr:hypothetical protein EYF80_045856 [Liparis tanakae]
MSISLGDTVSTPECVPPPNNIWIVDNSKSVRKIVGFFLLKAPKRVKRLEAVINRRWRHSASRLTTAHWRPHAASHWIIQTREDLHIEEHLTEAWKTTSQSVSRYTGGDKESVQRRWRDTSGLACRAAALQHTGLLPPPSRRIVSLSASFRFQPSPHEALRASRHPRAHRI